MEQAIYYKTLQIKKLKKLPNIEGKYSIFAVQEYLHGKETVHTYTSYG
jgi:hypothetical protein